MEKFGQFICKHKVAILIISLLLLIPSIIGYKATRVNYDILVYLPDNIETIKGENILADDFDMGAFSVVILENRSRKCRKSSWTNRHYRNRRTARDVT